MTWKLVRNAGSQAYPSPPDSQPLRMGTSDQSVNEPPGASDQCFYLRITGLITKVPLAEIRILNYIYVHSFLSLP